MPNAARSVDSRPAAAPPTPGRRPGAGGVVEVNAHLRELTAAGVGALSVVLDLPTRAGQDSDDPAAAGRVGAAGVAIDSLDDMRVLFAGIPLGRVEVALAADAPAAVLLLLHQLVAEEQGFEGAELVGTVHNDPLREHLLPGPRLLPARAGLRLAGDLFDHARAELPRWRTLALCGRPQARAGASPAQEIAFTLANALEYTRTALAGGYPLVAFAPRVSLCLSAPAHARTAARLWPRLLRDAFGAEAAGVPAPRFRVHPLRDPRPGPGPGPRADARPAAVEAAAGTLLARIEAAGGAVAAIEAGLPAAELGPAPATPGTPTLPTAPGAGAARPPIEVRQAERLAKLRAWRDGDRVALALAGLGAAAGAGRNVLPPMRTALAAGATLAETCAVLRTTWP
ncbi:methylmalonyl-CoA mutase family protein (plasmid) [Streptomyces sp. BI20]|uniref:methylmalonyl-CoA mutase family protein n=1 Tax=Streptomyces sp. BI20 TaxID=3403460 RepID=UPI003C73CF36